MPKWSHHLLFGAVSLVLAVGLGNDSPPALIDQAQMAESGLLEFENKVLKNPTLLGSNGSDVIHAARTYVEPFKKLIEADAIRVAKITGLDYDYESRTITEASLRYINLVARIYYLYAKAAHFPKNNGSVMSFAKLSEPNTLQLDIKLPRRIGLGLITVGTYLTPRHDEQDPRYWWFSLPISDRMLSEMFALARNEEGDLTMTKDFESEGQAQSELIERYRSSTFRINTETEYARLLQFIAMRESLFNRWVINRLRSQKIPETPLNSCGSGEFLSFRTSGSSPQVASLMPAYTGWAEQEEREYDLRYASQKITALIKNSPLATSDEHFAIFLAAMRAQPGFDKVKEKIKMTFQLPSDAGIDAAIRSQFKDSQGLTEGVRVSNSTYNYWSTDGAKIVWMANRPADPFVTQKMAERVAYFSYEALRDQATSQIAADLLAKGWVDFDESDVEAYDRAFESIVNFATPLYDAKFKEPFKVNITAKTQVIYDELRNPVIKATINQKILQKKVESILESAKPVLPWVKEYRQLRLYALSKGYIKEYDADAYPQASPYEHLMLNQKSGVTKYGRVESYSATLLALESRLGLEPNQKVAEWLSLDDEFFHLYTQWIGDSAEEYKTLYKSKSVPESEMLSKAFAKATEKMRERAQPTYLMRLGNWIDESVKTQPETISDSTKKAIVDFLSGKKPVDKKPTATPLLLSGGTIVDPNIPKIAEWIKTQKVSKPSVSQVGGTVQRNQINLGYVPGPKLHEKVEHLIAALGFAGALPKKNDELLKTDYDRMRYGMYQLSEVIGVEPMLGIPIFDEKISEVMDGMNNYKDDGLFAGVETGPSSGIKTRSGRVKHADDKLGRIPQYSRLIELMGDVYTPIRIPEQGPLDSIYSLEKTEVLIKTAIETAAVKGAGVFETFCGADAKKWDSDPSFKKIFMSTVTLRKSMTEIDKKLAGLDKSMQKELRSPMDKLQEDYLKPIMDGLFYVTIVFMALTLPLSPLSAVVTAFIKAYVPTIFITLASFSMFWGFNGAMVANIVTRSWVNFYEKPMEVKFAQAVAAQNLGDSDKDLTSWAETVKQQAQLKSDQNAAIQANVIDGLFAAMFVGQFKQAFGYKAEQAARELGLNPLSVAERRAESMTSREHAKWIQTADEAVTGKPTRLSKLSREVDRRVEKFMRQFPKYQKFTHSELTQAFRSTLKNKLRGVDLNQFKPEIDAYLDYQTKSLNRSSMRLDEIIENPELNDFWSLPQSIVRAFRKRIGNPVSKLDRLGQEWYELAEDTHVLQRQFKREKIKLATSIEEKRIASLEMGDEAGPYWIDILTDQELTRILPDIAKGPGGTIKRAINPSGGPMSRSVLATCENYKKTLEGFVPVQYRPRKSWFGDNIDELRYTEKGAQAYELEKTMAKQNRAADPRRDLDDLQIKAIEATYGDLVNRKIVDGDTGQVIQSIASLSESDQRLLERYLRGENFKLAMTEAKLDFKNPWHVSEFQDVVDYYKTMQANDGSMVLEDLQYKELQKRLEKKLGVVDMTLEEMVKEHNLR